MNSTGCIGWHGQTEKPMKEGYSTGFRFIWDIDTEEQTLTVLFDDDKTVVYDFFQLDELELSYAISAT